MDQSAPMPNRDITGPLVLEPQGAQFSVSNFRIRRTDQSLGYGPGSQYETTEDKRPIPTPGLTIRVPLQ
jgi:hypothetical protein